MPLPRKCASFGKVSYNAPHPSINLGKYSLTLLSLVDRQQFGRGEMGEMLGSTGYVVCGKIDLKVKHFTFNQPVMLF